jgi:hypothetical protein
MNLITEQEFITSTLVADFGVCKVDGVWHSFSVFPDPKSGEELTRYSSNHPCASREEAIAHLCEVITDISLIVEVTS